MRNLLLSIVFLFSSSLVVGQFGGCGNRVNSVTFSPIAGTADLTVSIDSSCCDVHNLDGYEYTNNAPSHTLRLCYRDSGLLMQTNITSQIVLPNVNTAGTQNFTINSFYYFGIPGGSCSENTVFNGPITLSFNAPLTEPRVFLANDTFEKRNLSLYPNPNNGEFSIDLPAVTDEVQLHVFDLSGKEVYTNLSYYSANPIELKNLSKGIYFVKVLSGESTDTLKFVIQ